MTRQRSLKRRIRARMAETGESYATARRQVLSDLELDDEATASPARNRWWILGVILGIGACSALAVGLAVTGQERSDPSRAQKSSQGRQATELVVERLPRSQCAPHPSNSLEAKYCFKVATPPGFDTSDMSRPVPMRTVLRQECEIMGRDARNVAWCSPARQAKLVAVARGVAAHEFGSAVRGRRTQARYGRGVRLPSASLGSG